VIAKTFRQNSEEVLQVEQGSLYPPLHRLVKRNWISAEDGTSANNVPRLTETAIDLWVVGFALSISTGAGIVFGAGPAIVPLRDSPMGALKEVPAVQAVAKGCALAKSWSRSNSPSRSYCSAVRVSC
jgi:hypothetical protein